jgi:hypothetical protein
MGSAYNDSFECLPFPNYDFFSDFDKQESI